MSLQLHKTHLPSKREGNGSRLTPFEKLPRIGSSNEYTPRPPATHHSTTNPRSKYFVKQPILIAIRLSDGRRLEKQFYSTDQIRDIIQFVKSQQNFLDDDIYLSTGDVPKRQFKDFNLTLLQANLSTRTVLFMEDVEEEKSIGNFYRKFLNNEKVFLTEVNGRSSSNSSQSECLLIDRSRSVTPSSISIKSEEINDKLVSTRQECRQRLITCSRKKLSLLTFQEQTDKRSSKFQKFIDGLDVKRRTNIHRYQMELKDYLLKRLEADRLKQELIQLNNQKNQLEEEKQRYFPLMKILKEAIPLFPSDLFQGSSNPIHRLMLRHETLYESKKSFEQRDNSTQKQQGRKRLKQIKVEHETETTKLRTRIKQLDDQLNQLEQDSHNQEQNLLYQMDLNRTKTTIIGQIESCINYLYERYRLFHQIEKGTDHSIAQKLIIIQDFILYRTDLLQRAKQEIN